MKRYQLSKAGVSASEAIERFNGDKKLYEEMLLSFPQDQQYGNLCEALNTRDIKAAFVAAHSLKGLAGNLSMNRLFEDISPLVEVLRNNSWDNADEYMTKVHQDYQDIIRAINS